jgi:hypothetical protein
VRNDSASLSDVERSARWALNRHYYGQGRWGYPEGEAPARMDVDGWFIERRDVTLLDPQEWAKTLPGPRGQKGKKVHAIKYVATATRGKHTYTLTVWRCGQQTFSRTETVVDPSEVCGNCYDRIHSRTTVRLSTGA